MSAALSTVFAAVQNNFGLLYAGGPVPFYFGPEWLGVQSGPNQIVAFPTRDTFEGPQVTYNAPGQPRQLRRAWTTVEWMLWSAWAPLTQWSAGATIAGGANGIPSAGNANGFMYTANATGGATGATEPVWPTTLGASVLDGTVTWTNAGTTAAYTVTKTDNVEAMRAALVQAHHEAMSGASYRLIRGDWYRESDQFAMVGVLYVLTVEYWIPLSDSIETPATITAIPLNTQMEAS